MNKLKITSDGTSSGTVIQDAHGHDIPGLSVQKVTLIVDALKDECEPTVTLVLCPHSVDFDIVANVTGVQVDILTAIHDKLQIIQDTLHGKSLSEVQDEIVDVEHEIAKILKEEPETGLAMCKQKFPREDDKFSVTGDVQAYFDEPGCVIAKSNVCSEVTVGDVEPYQITIKSESITVRKGDVISLDVDGNSIAVWRVHGESCNKHPSRGPGYMKNECNCGREDVS